MANSLLNVNTAPNSYGTMSSSNTTPEVAFAGFSPTEFYTLCENITTNIYTVNGSWKSLERTLKLIGTKKDNHALRDKSHILQKNTNQTIAVTSKELKRLTAIVGRGDKQQKLQVEKLTSDFKEAVAKYSTVQTQVADKKKSCWLPMRQTSTENAEDRSEMTQEQMQVSQDLIFEQEMLVEREARIKGIEEDILDVNTIMKELSLLTVQQGEAVNTIETNVESTTANIEHGASELIKAARYQNKFRGKLCIVLVIGLVVVAVLITILVVELKR